MQDFSNLINLFLEKKISYDSFNSCWINMYIDGDLSDNFPEKVQDILEEIHEKIELTIEEPINDREWGYINPDELRVYIKDKLGLIKDFLKQKS